jgi:ribonuclease BN (tRNA processing enzyme)
MKVTLLGTGFALPSAKRAQSGILVETRENLILFDLGAGVLHRLEQSSYNLEDITHVFFTHHHLDHDSDFMVLLKARWLRGRRELQVFGPVGTKEWLTKLLEAYPYLKGRVTVKTRELEDRARVKLGRDVVEARENKHSLGGLAYRLTSLDVAVVYSGDTAPCRGVKELCIPGVELLIHECSFPDAEGEKYADHTTPTGLGRLISGMQVKKLVLTHFSPIAEEGLEEMVSVLKKHFKGEVIIGEDLMELRL